MLHIILNLSCGSFTIILYGSELALKHTVMGICMHCFTFDPPDHLQSWVEKNETYPSPTKVVIRAHRTFVIE